MMPLLLALLGLVAFYLGVIGGAFALLMRLSLRLGAERSDRSELLAPYLDSPVLLFLPIRVMLALVHVAMMACAMWLFGTPSGHTVALAAGVVVVLAVCCEHVLPFAVVRHDPEGVLESWLRPFDIVARGLGTLFRPIWRLSSRRVERPLSAGENTADNASASNDVSPSAEGLIEGDGRRLLQSIVDFGDTLVREVMTPRPDIVAIRSTSTLGDLYAFFREQEYSRIPVYAESLDNVIGFIFIKDLMRLPANRALETPVSSLVRPPHVVPETKKVAELLKEFQRHQVQMAIVVDEYGGTAGLVTLEDLLEELVGEIRDEYDVETEPVVEEPDGGFLVTGKADVHAVADRLGLTIDAEGFETFGGFVLASLGRVPAAGERFRIDGLQIDVLDAERRRVHRVRVRRLADTDTPAPPSGLKPAGESTA